MPPIENYLQMIESEINNGSKSFFGDKVTVNAGVILQAVRNIRNELPGVISEAQQIVDNANKIVNDSYARAKYVLDDAKAQANALVSVDEVHNAALSNAQMIKADAEAYEQKVKSSVKQDVNVLLNEVEKALQAAMDAIQHGKELNK